MYDIIKTLIEKKITIATCESCTGGLLGAALTSVPGASLVYLEGAVTYSNDAKVRLGVLRETIAGNGAVSGEAAVEMALCIKNRTGADIGVSTTGIAGPGGGSKSKPVGLVFVGIAFGDNAHAIKLNLSGDRNQIRNQTVERALICIGEVI